jgi:hypothetical protein
MADSKRQQIVDALIVRLKEIQKGDTYTTDLGKSVHLWNFKPLDLESGELLPAVCVKDSSSTIEPGRLMTPKGKQKHSLKIECLIINSKEPGKEADATGRELLKDFYAVIGKDQTFGGLADWVTDISDEFQVEQDGKTVSNILVKFSIQYETAAFAD